MYEVIKLTTLYTTVVKQLSATVVTVINIINSSAITCN